MFLISIYLIIIKLNFFVRNIPISYLIILLFFLNILLTCTGKIILKKITLSDLYSQIRCSTTKIVFIKFIGSYYDDWIIAF